MSDPRYRTWTQAFAVRWCAAVAQGLGGEARGLEVRLPGLVPGTHRLVRTPLLSAAEGGAARIDCEAAPQPGEPVLMRMALQGRDARTCLADDASASARRSVRKAQDQAWRIERGGVEAAAAVINAGRRRLGAPVTPVALFHALEQHGLAEPWRVVGEGGRTLGAAFVTDAEDTVWIGWWANQPGAGAPAFSPLHALGAAILEQACRDGRALLDFGRSPYASPAFEFKRRFGARPVALATDGGPQRLYALHRRLSGLWGVIPAPLAGPLGRYVFARLIR